MHIEPAIEPSASPVAAIAPKPVGGDTAARRPVRSVLAKAMSILHGDKYMIGAYPDDEAASAAPPSKRR